MARPTFVLLFVASLFCIWTSTSMAADPELTSDFALPAGLMNSSSLDASFFTFSGFRHAPRTPADTFAVNKAFVSQFPALNGLGVSYASLVFRPKTLNPPHTHPRGTELLFVTHGILHVGLVDSSNKLYEQVLQEGDVFVFPKGLVHFQINRSGHKTAKAMAAFSSSNPGVVSLPGTLFGSGIDKSVLMKAFNIQADALNMLESPFAMMMN